MQKQAKTILIIDDDKELCDLLTDYLEGEGFRCHTANDGVAGLEKTLTGSYDLVILDVMLPKQNGFDVLRALRVEKPHQPVIMLTAKGEETDKVVGLELGADDYLHKPFSPRELLARIRSILRRMDLLTEQQAKEISSLKTADIELWPTAMKTIVDGNEIPLTTVEFRLLEKMLEKPGEVIGRELLYKSVLGHYSQPFERSLDMHVSRLRKKLGPRQDGGERIKAVRGEGYILLN